MNQRVKKLVLDDLLRSAGLLSFAGAFTSGYNYFFHVSMGRFLSKADYAVFGVLFALSFYLGFILIMTLRVTSAGFISGFVGKDRRRQLVEFYTRFLVWMTVLGGVLFVLYAALSPLIADFLRIEQTHLVIVVGLVFFLSWILPVNLGALQGLQRFNHLGLNNILRAGSKFVMGLALVLLGFGVGGAVAGLLVGTLLTVLVSFYLLKDILRFPEILSELKKMVKERKRSKVFDIGVVSKYSVHILIGLACLSIPSNIDLMLVKNLFTTEQTALYTAASVFGRIIFFLPVGIVTALYPKVVAATSKGKDTRPLLTKSLVYTVVPSVAITLALVLLPGFFIRVLYGPGYLDARGMLQWYALTMFVFSLVAVVTYYYLAKKVYRYVYCLALASVLQLGLAWTLAGSPEEVLKFMFAGYLALMVVFLIMMSLSRIGREIREEVNA